MKKFITITISALLFSALSASAQDNGKEDRRDGFKAQKIAYLTTAMDLTSKEAERFWPVYNRCEAEKHESFMSICRAYQQLDEAIKADKSDNEISSLIDAYLKAQEDGKEIDAKYTKEYRKIISAKKVGKLYIAEESFRREQIHRLRKNGPKND